MIDEVDTDVAPQKKPKVASVPKRSTKRKLTDEGDTNLPHKKRTKVASAFKRSANAGKDCEVVHVDRPTVSRTEWPEYRYFPIDEDWQRQTCRILGLRLSGNFNGRMVDRILF